jgi:hypothetical protein
MCSVGAFKDVFMGFFHATVITAVWGEAVYHLGESLAVTPGFVQVKENGTFRTLGEGSVKVDRENVKAVRPVLRHCGAEGREFAQKL